ncbi:tripartite tricarboxylate transporter substrate binding protein [Bordetella petrii]|nr:tripartite tricarboxylate transporter substrate binding protein [Bordetella petrii]
MTMHRRRFLQTMPLLGTAAIAAAGALAPARRATAGAYPDKPIQLVIPFAAGGPTDMLGRFLSRSLSQQLGQSVVVMNRPGAGGNIGTQFVARTEPDGYTLLLVASSHAINPAVYDNLQYDPIADFSAISLLASGPFILTVRNDLPVKSVGDLIDLARSAPGRLTYASAGTGTANHLAGELFKQLTDVDITHVPYNGAAPASQAILAGTVDILFNNMLSGMPMVKAGQVRALAVTGPKRSAALPDLPTVAESGVDGFDVQTWYALLAPANCPEPIRQVLNDGVGKALADKEGRTLLDSQGLEWSPTTPQDVAAFLSRERSKWAEIAKRSGARAD